MNSTSTVVVIICRRILQTNDINAFNVNIPQTSFSPPTFNSSTSTALTIFILLAALFFLAVYIHRFSAADNNAPPPKCGGLHSSAVSSLPLVPYNSSRAAAMIDECPICLSEFGESETVKFIPYCGHVFHPTCIDTWLNSHVTCPLCRSADLFHRGETETEEVCLDVAPVIGDERSTAEIESCDAWSSDIAVRRTCSCSNLANRAVLLLQRSTSF